MAGRVIVVNFSTVEVLVSVMRVVKSVESIGINVTMDVEIESWALPVGELPPSH